MPNYNSDLTAEEFLTCSKEDADIILATLNGEISENDGETLVTDEASNLTASFSLKKDSKEGELYFYAEENAIPDEIPNAFVTSLGNLLTKLARPFLEFGIAFTCTKHCPGSHGGTSFRITNKGQMISPTLSWPED